MSRLNSFHLAPELWREPFVLEGPEARHLIKVLRAGPGETIRLFDGCGREGLFEIRELDKRSARLARVSEKESPELKSQLYAALGFGKQARRDVVLEKCVELGGAGLVFWQAERSQGKMISEPKPAWYDKTVQAAKQCGALFLPELEIVPGGATGLAEFGNSFDHKLLLWEAAVGSEKSALLEPGMLIRPGKTLAVIGPEGGLTDQEAEILMKAGFTPVHLGKHILRWETAALLCLSSAYLARQADERD